MGDAAEAAERRNVIVPLAPAVDARPAALAPANAAAAAVEQPASACEDRRQAADAAAEAADRMVVAEVPCRTVSRLLLFLRSQVWPAKTLRSSTQRKKRADTLTHLTDHFRLHRTRPITAIMAANPPLTQLADGTLAPTIDAAAAEALVLARTGMRFTIDNVRTPSKK